MALCLTNINAQNSTFPSKEQAEKHFSSFLYPESEKELIKLFMAHQPTKEDCQAMFTDDYYLEAFDKFDAMFSELPKQLPKEFQEGRYHGYNYVYIKTFQTDNFLREGNGRMRKVSEKVRPGITYYQVKLVKEEYDTSGLSFLLFTYLNGKWVWFPFN